MPPSSQKCQPEPSMRTRLLDLAQRLPLFLSQDNQTYVACPTAIPVYSEDFFVWLFCLAEKRLGYNASASEIGRVARMLDAQACGAKTREFVHTRIAKTGTKSYQLDLGTDDHQVVNITGQHWQQSQHFDVRFERLEDYKSITTPIRTANTLAACMEAQFSIATDTAEKLALWVAQALLPDQHPPILVITGNARVAAVEKLRNLIDPVNEPIIETPTNFTALPRMALENKVLAFSVNDQFPEKIRKAINELHQGKRLQLKHCNRNRIKLRSTAHRTVIIATEQAQQISPSQFNIEINEAIDFEFGKIMGALLNLMVQIIGQPIVRQAVMTMPEPGERPAMEELPGSDSS